MALKSVPDRIAELEDELRQRDIRIKELRADLHKAEALIGRMREHVSDCVAQLELGIAASDMRQDERGVWKWRAPFAESDEWFEKYDALLRD